jgi:hypothetical protein
MASRKFRTEDAREFEDREFSQQASTYGRDVFDRRRG